MDKVFRQTSRAVDAAHLTVDERRHVPIIEAPEVVPAGELFTVTVKVSELPHPMDMDHYIQFIELYAGQTLLTHVMFTPTLPKPKVTYFLVLDENVTLRAVAFCNRHGFWEADHQIVVEE